MNGYEMFRSVADYLDSQEKEEAPSFHASLAGIWWESVTKNIELFVTDFNKDEITEVEEIIEVTESFYDTITAAALRSKGSRGSKGSKESDKTKEKIKVLCDRPQIEQRTDEWYAEYSQILSASELWQLFASERQRALLVLTKVNPSTFTGSRLSCHSSELGPMDWGVRFEPVAKLILEDLWKVKITDLGRLRHSTKAKLAASPDGLITEGPDDLLGTLLEIKCPLTRLIGKEIPSKYWYQMQLQMEVADIDECQYAEFVFDSLHAKNMEASDISGSLFKGLIYFVQNDTTHQTKYIYGSLNQMKWTPTLEDGWEVLEKIPWYLTDMHTIPVKRDKVWFERIQPQIDTFWDDVAKAVKGDFTVPESTRKKKTPVCAFID